MSKTIRWGINAVTIKFKINRIIKAELKARLKAEKKTMQTFITEKIIEYISK